jgi:hypothetical protein
MMTEHWYISILGQQDQPRMQSVLPHNRYRQPSTDHNYSRNYGSIRLEGRLADSLAKRPSFSRVFGARALPIIVLARSEAASRIQ